jgi:hypothetical protein
MIFQLPQKIRGHLGLQVKLSKNRSRGLPLKRTIDSEVNNGKPWVTTVIIYF